MNQKECLTIRIPVELNKALGDKVKPVGMSKCAYVLRLIAEDLGMLENDADNVKTTNDARKG